MVLLEGTVARAAKALEPLAQIANLRRLGDREMREAARTILEHRSTRLSSKPEAPRALPAEDASPFDYSSDVSGETAEEDTGAVPPPLTLPLTD
jgi:hypothetical protein